MLQDIEPYQFNNEFKNKEPENSDYVLIFQDEELLLENLDGQFEFPTLESLSKRISDINESLVYLFSVDDSAFYYSSKSIDEVSGMCYKNVQALRESLPKLTVFVASTANHLVQWYNSNRYCGRCGALMSRSKTERALCCDTCGMVKYPNISPAIIVGIIDKKQDKLLMTRYADRPYKKLGLVAGFTEIGETLENTVKREVMEEVGLRVKNIKYFKNQPWAFSQSLLIGFFAELEGTSVVTVDKTELSEAMWFSRDAIQEISESQIKSSNLSLTNQMIETFRANKISAMESE